MSVFTLPKYPINGRDAEEEARRLHFRKNRPEVPDVEFPPHVHRPFPTCMYRLNNDGETEAQIVGVHDFDDEGHIVEALRSRNEAERLHRLSLGWAHSPADIRTARREFEKRIAIQAAESNYDDRKLTGKAREERNAIEDAASDHLVDVPTAPKASGSLGQRVKTAIENASERLRGGSGSTE